VKTSKQILLLMLTAAAATINVGHPLRLSAQTSTVKSSSESSKSSSQQWSVQVDKVDPGEVNLEPSFQVAIYEDLFDELSKTKRFKQVLRDGDRNAGEVSDLLILKTTVEKYTAGSETKRAVTTFSGATKLTVRSQLCTRDGGIILELTINGNVRFMGSNLRATHNLARNVAKAIKRSPLPEASLSAPKQSTQQPVTFPKPVAWSAARWIAL
jgi:hypothetical protein